MEKKKAEILAHFNHIIESKDSIILNLTNIGKEIENAVNLINAQGPSELRQSKHLLNLMKYELSFMKVLSEVSFLVDSFVEEEQFPVIRQARSTTSLTSSRTSSVCDDNVDCKMDIVTLKEQFQLLNEKIQTTCPAVLEYVANYYRSSSSNVAQSQNGFTLPSPTSLMPFATPFENHYEVPEKDQVKAEVVSPPAHDRVDPIKANPSPNAAVVLADNAYHVPSLTCDTHETSVREEPKVDTLIDLSDAGRTQQTCNDVSSVLVNVDPEKTHFQTIASQSANQITLKNVCPADDSDSDSEIIEIMDGSVQQAAKTSESTSTTESSISGIDSSTTPSSSGTSGHCSTLDKLNNITIHDRREQAMKKLNPPYIPDLSLKPLLDGDNRAKVDLYNNRKLKKQKNKVATNGIVKDIDLQEAETPKEGEEVVFSYIINPSEFYLHVVNDQTRNIDNIADQISTYYNDSAPIFNTKTEAKALSGKYCVARVLGSWYRVEIIDWLMDNTCKNDDVHVYLVDFGDKHKVPYTVLRHMPTEVVKIPKLAVRCHLICLYPPESTRTNLLSEWPTESVDALMNLSGITSQELKFFRLEYCDKTENSLAVDLLNDADQDTIGQILLDVHLAVQFTNLQFADEDENLNTFLTDADNLNEADDITEAVQGYSAMDESRVCKFVRAGKRCYKGDKCRFEHIDLSKEAFTTDTVLVHMEAFSLLHLPSVGSEVIVLVTGFIDICRFYVHMVHNPINVGNHLIDRTLYDLMEVMNHFDLTKVYTPFKIWPAMGEIVAVKHWATKKWLRGKVRHLIMDEDGKPKAAQVFMVDFGEIVDVPFTCIRQINEDFLHLPFQAVEVYLSDVQQRKDVDKESAHKFFLENMCLKNFNATILSAAEPLSVCIQTMMNVNISRTLLRLDLVDEKDDDLCPSENSKIQPA